MFGGGSGLFQGHVETFLFLIPGASARHLAHSVGVSEPCLAPSGGYQGTCYPVLGVSYSRVTTPGPRGTTQGTRGTTQCTRGNAQGPRDTTQGTRGTTQGTRGITPRGNHHTPNLRRHKAPEEKIVCFWVIS